LTERAAAVSSQTLLVLTTCGTAADAGSLAALLVEQRLAACVNIVEKVTSTYRWQGRVQTDQETLLVVKTTAARYPAVENAIRTHSKYELPEVVAIPVAAGSSAYLEWVRESVAASED
jgi:periplasmic divalent cation tolerance protein